MASKKKQEVDERFLRVQKDPRFWEMPERERKVKIDKRFHSMFHDQRFKVKYTVDKRGRPLHQTSTEDLKRFYQLTDSEEEEEEEEERRSEKKKPTKKKKKEEEESEDDEDDDDDDDDEEEESGSEEEGAESEEDSDSGPDLARGKGNVETSSDEDEDDDEEVDLILRREEEDIEHDWGELAKDAPRSEEVSSRLAVCNMDWDRLKAKDLLALLHSFCPTGGAVLSVKIYPSEFGKERLKVEETQGPLELRALPEDSEDDTEEDRGYREKMRDYQFKRLKYFYAVAECDSVDTAAKIYQECDGYEYESSCSVLDLRFIPDDVAFEEEPKDVATDVNLAGYTPKLFTSSAAATSKVQLTWDETDHERVTALNRKFNKGELLDMDFQAYLASSSEDEDAEVGEWEGLQPEEGGATTTADAAADNVAEEVEEEPEQEQQEKEEKKKKKKKNSEEQISKYRDLLKSIQDREKKLHDDKDMEMEVTWVPGLKETTEQLVKKKMEVAEPLTPWEEFLQKKKDKKKHKKASKQRGDEDEESDDQIPSDVDLSDPFFAEELAPAERKKKPKEQQQQKKRKKKKGEEEEGEERTAEEEAELERQKAEMALLMDDDDKHKHFNYDKIVERQNLSKKKKKQLLRKGAEPEEQDDFQVDVKDDRFQAMFTSHLFNLDPSHPAYRKTRATDSILAEKQRRRHEEERRRAAGVATSMQTTANKQPSDSQAPPTKTLDPSLSLLVKSIKNKTQQFQARKKQKLQQ